MSVLCICALALPADMSDADAAVPEIGISPEGDDYAKVSGTLKFTMTYAIPGSTSMTYKASVVDTGGNSAGGSVSTSSGSLSGSGTKTLTVTLPSTAGDYMLKVVVTDSTNAEEPVEYERFAYFKAVEPITLSVTLENNGEVARSFKAYFYVLEGEEWVQVDENGQNVTIEAGGSKDVTYDYIVRDVSKTTFCVQADDATIGSSISGLGTDHAHTYYTESNDYSLVEYLCAGILIVLAIVAIWIYRKPIKNRGKPKARR
ncbi:MAG: hypothetical protein J6O90_05160 [Candidatus Methanomethylophilaceae archaeon]|nr:hypothetical protein [Candidatus Methanomethylophilaceae archaeon]